MCQTLTVQVRTYSDLVCDQVAAENRQRIIALRDGRLAAAKAAKAREEAVRLAERAKNGETP